MTKNKKKYLTGSNLKITNLEGLELEKSVNLTKNIFKLRKK